MLAQALKMELTPERWQSQSAAEKCVVVSTLMRQQQLNSPFHRVPNLPEKDSAKAGRGARKVDIPVVHLIRDMFLLPLVSCKGTHGYMQCSQVVGIERV